MNDDAIAGEPGSHRRGKFFIFAGEKPWYLRKHESRRSRTDASLARAPAHPDRRR